MLGRKGIGADNGEAAVQTAVDGRKDAGDAAGQQQGEQDVEENGGPVVQQAQQAQDNAERGGGQHLAEVDVVACQRVVEAEVQGVAEEVVHKQGDGRGVCPDDGGIHEPEEPAAEKGVVVAEHGLHVAEGAAVAGMPAHQVMVVEGDDDHGEGADGKHDACADRPRLGQEHVAWQNECAPPDAAAKGHGP